MSAHDELSIQHLLRQAVPPVHAESGPEHDLWPAVRRKLNTAPARNAAARQPALWIWFDWALLAGLAVVLASFPASIPLLLYFL